MYFNKTFTQEYTPSFLKAVDKNHTETHGSLVSPSKTPPKLFDKLDEKGHGRTPTKYRTVNGNEVAKKSAISKSPDN